MLEQSIASTVQHGVVMSVTVNRRKRHIEPDRKRLSRREYEALKLYVQGKTYKEVAVAMGISVKTAETYKSNIYLKLGVHSQVQLVKAAVRTQRIRCPYCAG